MRLIVTLALACLLFSCEKTHVLKEGPWRGIVDVQGQELPMNFNISKSGDDKYKVAIKNDEEEILLDEVSVTTDSIVMFMHIFDTEIHAAIGDGKLTGYYIKNYEKDFKLPFTATFGDSFRFVEVSNNAEEDFAGKYSVTFVSPTDTTVAVGIFEQSGNELTGTFLTPTGDYRYLQGNVVDGEMMLSTFDGNHAFVFKARKEGGKLVGDFWSGKDSHETWTAFRDENASLPDAEKLTYLKEGFDRIDFIFPDLDGNMVSPSDERFNNKILILQIFGTWCPNCMDETRFLSQWFENNKHRDVSILGLAYEAKDDFAYASARVRKMKSKLNVPYEFVIAGNKDKVEAAKTLPMLNHVLSFPTTIFIDKNGEVKRIHTGFTGPGTGVFYEEFIQSFNKTVDELLSDNLASSQ